MAKMVAQNGYPSSRWSIISKNICCICEQRLGSSLKAMVYLHLHVSMLNSQATRLLLKMLKDASVELPGMHQLRLPKQGGCHSVKILLFKRR